MMRLEPWDFETLDPEFVSVVRELQAHNQCGSPEPELLFALSHAVGGLGEIVEVGTYVGTSLICLAYAQKLRRERRLVTSVDVARHKRLDEYIDRAGVAPFVRIVTGKSEEVAKNWTMPIALLWIDADHSYEGCLTDILAWERHVTVGGLIAFHDFADGTGVPGAVRDTLLSSPWMYRVVLDRGHSSIFVVERIGGNQTPAWKSRCSRTDAYTNLGRLAAERLGQDNLGLSWALSRCRELERANATLNDLLETKERERAFAENAYAALNREYGRLAQRSAGEGAAGGLSEPPREATGRVRRAGRWAGANPLARWWRWGRRG